MRWTLRISFLLFLAWIIFLVSPFVALYDLSKAVEARDLERIGERVNFRALRISFTRQILGDYLKNQDLGEFDRQSAAQAGAAVLNPFIEELLTPEALIDLMKNGWRNRTTARATTPALPLDFNAASLKSAFRTFFASQGDGFRSVTIPLPENEPKEKQFRLTMRLSGTTWRLTDVELPDSLQKELAKRAPRFEK